MRILFTYWLLILLTSVYTTTVFAQKNTEQFGKNRIQYKTFDWEFFSTDKYEVYFYKGGEHNAETTMSFLEDEFDEITTVLGHHPYHKPKIFIYNSQYELAQSNVGVSEDSFYQGGKTKFTKSFIEIAYTGTYEGFTKELKFQISKMIINDQVYGGSLLSMFKSGLLHPIPDWYISGLARYIAEGWSVEMDDYIRDLLINKKKRFRKLNRYRGKEAAIIGQSIWNYIVNIYKKNSISYITNLTRLSRDEEKSIPISLGIADDFKTFLIGWQDYYLKQKTLVKKNYDDLDSTASQSKKKKSTIYLNNVVFSLDGEKIAYTRMEEGKFKVIVKKVGEKREKVIYKGGSKLIDFKVTKNLPLISWRNNDELGIVTTKRGSLVLYVININNSKKYEKDLSRFKLLNGFSFSNSGTLAVVSGTIKDNSDIYIISLKRNGIKKITRDVYDDIAPKFIPGKKMIIFASNRNTDSLLFKRKKKLLRTPKSIYNIYLYDIDTSRYLLKKITNLESINTEPHPIDAKNYLYLSDIKGINQLFHFDLETKINTQLTNFSNSIQTFDYNSRLNRIAFVSYKKGYSQVFVVDNFQLRENKFTKNTPMADFKHIKKYIATQKQKKKTSAVIKQLPVVKEKLPKPIPPSAKVKEVVKENEQSLLDVEKVKFVKDSNIQQQQYIIDTDNYVFISRDKSDNSDKSLAQESYLEKYLKLLDKKQKDGPFPYQLRFATKSVVTDWLIDNYRGFGMNISTAMNSELENSQLKVGAFIPFNFNSGSDLFLGYEYLKYLLDFRIYYERNSVLRTQFINSSHVSSQVTKYNNISQRYVFNTFELGVGLPFSIAQRIELTPFFRNSAVDDLRKEIFLTRGTDTNDRDINYYGLRISWVYDNAVSLGNRVFDGLRARMSFEAVGNNTKELPVYRKFKIDARYSLPIHKEITFFTKVFYGRNSQGENMPKYMLGGIKNWISRQVTPSKDENDLLLVHRGNANENLLIHDFVMGLRGYDLNVSNGENAMLINFELRIPVFLYLSREHLSSKFLRQFVVGTFLDIGSTWDGDAILPELNDINREVIKPAGNIFEAVINNNNSPWLTSYGLRLSSIVFGFNIKFDMAIPYNNFVVDKTRYIFSIGYDL